MRLILATIVAAATLSTFATPVFADGERGRGDDNDRHENRGQSGERHDNRGHNGNYGHNRDHNRGNGHHGHRDHRFDNRHGGYTRPPFYQHHDNRGARYWGPSARQWSRWDNNWGDPNRYARQWGFDRYDHNRGWQRGNTWYSAPNQWSDWGGWSWSFSTNNGSYGHNNNYNNGNYQQQNAQCTSYRTHDWVNGQRATVTYVGCADRWGQVFEQPGTRRVERWGW